MIFFNEPFSNITIHDQIGWVLGGARGGRRAREAEGRRLRDLRAPFVRQVPAPAAPQVGHRVRQGRENRSRVVAAAQVPGRAQQGKANFPLFEFSSFYK